MKQILLLLVLVTCVTRLFAQIPQGFSYQAVARDNSGNPKPNTTLNVQFSILQGTPDGTVLYSESHVPRSNAFGLFNLTIGKGQTTLGAFTKIDWSDQKYIKVEIDGQLASTSLLLSVPYALYADKTSLKNGNGIEINGNTISNTGDLSNTNEIQTLSLAGTTLSLSSSNSVVLPVGTNYTAGSGISLSGNTINNTGDLSNTNELQKLQLTGNTLSLSNGGGNVEIQNLGQWVDTVVSGVKNIYHDGAVLVGVKGGYLGGANLVVGQNSLDINQNSVAAFNRTYNGFTNGMQIYCYPDSPLFNSYLQGVSMLYTSPASKGLQFTSMNGPLRFTTAGFASTDSERMRISSSGNIGIGTSLPAAKLARALDLMLMYI
jgi:hypothetical protein